jgi:hypothetical protein
VKSPFHRLGVTTSSLAKVEVLSDNYDPRIEPPDEDL